MLAASAGAWSQGTVPEATGTLATVTVREEAEGPESKNSLRATTTSIGKGTQELRDIPQTVTVTTERLIDDRNLDDFREVLKNTAGVTFQAGETGEEDVRLRGFSLGQAGDIYIDGFKDAPIQSRDTFNLDRVEVLKGSASMLFGKGSTGGVVNQVSKQPFLMTQHEVDYTLGTGGEHRLTGDFNFHTGENAAFRLNTMVHKADNYGAAQDRNGFAPSFRWGIGTADEFLVSFYHAKVTEIPNYSHRWFNDSGRLVPLVPARNFYGLASDFNDSQADYLTLGHKHRFADGGQLDTRFRHGLYQRDLWATVWNFAVPPTSPSDIGDDTVISRTSNKGRVATSRITQLQSDYTNTFDLGGRKHALIAGVDAYQDNAERNQNFPSDLVNSVNRPPTTVGNPNDGASVGDERGAPPLNTFRSRNLGVYAQDMISLGGPWKLVAGLRFDHFTASFRDSAGALTNERSDNLWSPRVGLLYQPSDTASYYASYGTSYNTSADAYQYAVTIGPTTPRSANTPPEKSRNFEVGAKFDLFAKRALLGIAAFYSEKYNERNTDPDVAATQELLSGKRHAAGLEFNLAGQITPRWDIFYNQTWIPDARIDQSNVPAEVCFNGVCGPNTAQQLGDRPGLTPRHSANLWTTYRVLPRVRVGAGINFRGSQQAEGNRTITAESFTTLDLMAEYTINQVWSARLNLSNVTNELYADALYRGFYVPGTERRAQLTVKAMF
ncbi:TonB-dependent siderophore receptor [Ramlibacter sp. PS3R-8]|uniref:TonB-dependent receptor n=1 Tax=Ramlibacter sp. PS3R-8 TaxID=3133437 RepID=UPI0030AC8701